MYFDLLIGVTEFFRDKQAFSSLRSSIAKMLGEVGDEEELRIWTLGCATGQEAYSLSILLSEEISKSDNPERKYKLFATDIHRRSLAIASAGIYTEEAMKGLTQKQKRPVFYANQRRRGLSGYPRDQVTHSVCASEHSERPALYKAASGDMPKMY